MDTIVTVIGWIWIVCTVGFGCLLLVAWALGKMGERLRREEQSRFDVFGDDDDDPLDWLDYHTWGPYDRGR